MIHSRKSNSALNNLSFQLLSTIFTQPSLLISNPALIHVSQQRHHLCVQHGREKLRLQCGMAKSFLQPVAPGITLSRVDLGFAEFLICWDVVSEATGEFAPKPDFEEQDNQDGRNSGYPEERFEAARRVL